MLRVTRLVVGQEPAKQRTGEYKFTPCLVHDHRLSSSASLRHICSNRMADGSRVPVFVLSVRVVNGVLRVHVLGPPSALLRDLHTSHMTDRMMQAADYFADEAAMQELCRLLGSRLFEGTLPEDASPQMREQKMITDDKVRVLDDCVLCCSKLYAS